MTSASFPYSRLVAAIAPGLPSAALLPVLLLAYLVPTQVVGIRLLTTLGGFTFVSLSLASRDP